MIDRILCRRTRVKSVAGCIREIAAGVVAIAGANAIGAFGTGPA